MVRFDDPFAKVPIGQRPRPAYVDINDDLPSAEGNSSYTPGYKPENGLPVEQE